MQSETLWQVREQFNGLYKGDVEELFNANGRVKKKGGMDQALDELVDCAVFGVPAPCPKCSGVISYS